MWRRWGAFYLVEFGFGKKVYTERSQLPLWVRGGGRGFREPTKKLQEEGWVYHQPPPLTQNGGRAGGGGWGFEPPSSRPRGTLGEGGGPREGGGQNIRVPLGCIGLQWVLAAGQSHPHRCKGHAIYKANSAGDIPVTKPLEHWSRRKPQIRSKSQPPHSLPNGWPNGNTILLTLKKSCVVSCDV